MANNTTVVMYMLCCNLDVDSSQKFRKIVKNFKVKMRSKIAIIPTYFSILLNLFEIIKNRTVIVFYTGRKRSQKVEVVKLISRENPAKYKIKTCFKRYSKSCSLAT